MSDRKIILIYSGSLRDNEEFTDKIHSNSGYLLYFGSDFRNFKKIRDSFGENIETIEISEKLDKISDQIRDDFNCYIDNVNRSNKDIFEWWFTPLSSRNIYLSEVFQNVCYLKLLQSISGHYLDKGLIIIVESFSAGRLIEKWAGSEKINIEVVSRPYRGRFYRLNQAFVSAGKTLFKATLNFFFAKFTGIIYGGKKKTEDALSGGKNALVDLFVYESNFGEDGSFKDRFFPGLEPYLLKNGYTVIYHPTLAETKLNKYLLYKKIRQNRSYFILGDDYLHMSDYFHTFILAVKAVTFSGKLPEFEGISISTADKYENKWINFDGIFKSILIYHLFLRLGDIAGNYVERIICWHENQLQDKALCLAVHRKFRDTKLIGIEHFIHYSNYLSFFPLDSEAEMSLLPDLILTTGPAENEKIKNHLSQVSAKSSASLRYSHLFDEEKSILLSKKELVVLLPYDRNDAFEVIMRVGEIIDDIHNLADVIIKCHPDYDSTIFDSYFKGQKWYEMIQFTDKNTGELYKSAAVVISAASGSVIEAAVSGIPTIMLAKANSLSLNPVYSVECPVIYLCYDRQSLTNKVEEYIQLSDEKRNDLLKAGNELKRMFFTPVNDDEMEVFIK